MRPPKYMSITGPHFKEAHSGVYSAYVKIRVKWWGWPVLYWKILKEEFDLSFTGWLYAIYKLPGLWIRMARQNEPTE